MAVKQPILRRDADLFEVIKLPNGQVVVRLTLEGYRFFEAILSRMDAGGI